MAEALAEKSCVPCQGGVEPLGEADARKLMAQTPHWQLLDGGTRIERKFKFKDFKRTLGFINELGNVAEEENHHPDICFGWGYATVSLQTHKIKGLHENDFIMAAKIDRLAG